MRVRVLRIRVAQLLSAAEQVVEIAVEVIGNLIVRSKHVLRVSVVLVRVHVSGDLGHCSCSRAFQVVLLNSLCARTGTTEGSSTRIEGRCILLQLVHDAGLCVSDRLIQVRVLADVLTGSHRIQVCSRWVVLRVRLIVDVLRSTNARTR
ncbi:hypothetical protein D3C71_1666480 [compost metagenome]